MILLDDPFPSSPLFGFVLLFLFAPPVFGVAALVAFFRKKQKWALFYFCSGALLLIGHAVFLQSNGDTAVKVWLPLAGVIGWVWWKFMRRPA